MGVFSRMMMMLTLAWMVALIVAFSMMNIDPEPSWREKFVAERNIRRALAYRYVDIKGGLVGDSGHDKGDNRKSAELQLDPESAGGTALLPGAKVRKDASLIAELTAQGADQNKNFRDAKDEAEKAIAELRTQISEALRGRRVADNRLATVRDQARAFATEMQSYRYIIASFQQKVFNLDYEIQRAMIERDALVAEVAQVTNDLKRLDSQQMELEDGYYDLSGRYMRIIKALAIYDTHDPDLRRLADATGRIGLHGKVIGVGRDARTGIVSISLGKNEGVQETQVFSIFRNGALIAKMRVDNVGNSVSVGKLLPEFMGKAIVVENDSVKSAESFGGATLKNRR